jgi:poly-gamma-glutamate synthesis protein (capsule biosynthesis protein)
VNVELPRTARDVIRVRRRDALLMNTLIAFAERTGLWRYPRKGSGDVETMRFLDRVYWLYKAASPARRAVRGSGLEAFFERQSAHEWRLPEGFEVNRTRGLSAVGDLMNHPFLAASGDSLYANVEELIFGVDVSMANLECVVLPSAAEPLAIDITAKTGPPLYFEPTAFDVVNGGAAHRYTFMATACNHSLDHGPAGISSTIDALRSRGISFHGINEREEDARTMSVLDTDGVKLGVMSFSFGLNARTPPHDRPRIVNRIRLDRGVSEIDWSQIQQQLAHGRRAGVDFVVAQLHWGMEFELYPRPEQIEIAHHLAEMGVDAIVGHHPHVLQPVEWYRTGRDPDRVVPIFYSLGNLTNPFSVEWMCKSGVARVELAKGITQSGATRTYVRGAEVVAVVQEAHRERGQLALKLA